MDGMYAGFAGAKACREKLQALKALYSSHKIKKLGLNARGRKLLAISGFSQPVCIFSSLIITLESTG
jgi:hypothetical protein